MIYFLFDSDTALQYDYNIPFWSLINYIHSMELKPPLNHVPQTYMRTHPPSTLCLHDVLESSRGTLRYATSVQSPGCLQWHWRSLCCCSGCLCCCLCCCCSCCISLGREPLLIVMELKLTRFNKYVWIIYIYMYLIELEFNHQLQLILLNSYIRIPKP